jgi:hypothetical protein
MLAGEDYYLPIYRKLLSILDAGPTDKFEIDRQVDNNPLMLKPERLFCGHFLDRLENLDAVAYKGKWQITDAGRSILEELGGPEAADDESGEGDE